MLLFTFGNRICRYIGVSLIMIFMSMLLGCSSTKKTDKNDDVTLQVPADHGLSAGQFTVQPGACKRPGNVQVSCPSGGSACTETVAAEGTDSYSRSRGMPALALVVPSPPIDDMPFDQAISDQQMFSKPLLLRRTGFRIKTR